MMLIPVDWQQTAQAVRVSTGSSCGCQTTAVCCQYGFWAAELEAVAHVYSDSSVSA